MAHEAGKGSKPRPFSVSQHEYDTRWDSIFGRDKPVDDEVLNSYNEGRLVSKFDKANGVSGNETQE